MVKRNRRLNPLALPKACDHRSRSVPQCQAPALDDHPAMHILLSDNASGIGGGNRSLLTLAVGLKRMGVDVDASYPTPGPMQQACDEADIPHRVIPLHQPSWRQPLATWRSNARWRRELTDIKPNILHANSMEPARSASIVTKRLNIPLLCHIRYPPTPDYIAWCFKRLPHPDAFIFISEDIRRECGSAIAAACPAAKQVVVHNAVRFDQFTPRPPHFEEARPKVVIVANLLPVKGHRDFLHAAKLLSDRHIDADYGIIGYDNHNSGYGRSLEQLAAELHITDRVTFHGFVNDVPALLQQASVLVCASTVEPFGRCLIEAMACQLPVVATRVGGIPEVVAENETGILVDAESPAQIADAIELLLADHRVRQHMGEAGRQRVEAMFSLETHAQAIASLYDDILH